MVAVGMCLTPKNLAINLKRLHEGSTFQGFRLYLIKKERLSQPIVVESKIVESSLP